MTFISPRHAQNVAASLRATAKENGESAARLTAEGDLFGAFIADSNARVAKARARLADEAAALLGDGPR